MVKDLIYHCFWVIRINTLELFIFWAQYVYIRQLAYELKYFSLSSLLETKFCFLSHVQWRQQDNMAAPCGRMASRSFLTFLSTFAKLPARHNQCRFFSKSLCRASLKTQVATERNNSPWTLMAAVCLQRLPVISADYTAIETKFNQILGQVSLACSYHLSHHLSVLTY